MCLKEKNWIAIQYRPHAVLCCEFQCDHASATRHFGCNRVYLFTKNSNQLDPFASELTNSILTQWVVTLLWAIRWDVETFKTFTAALDWDELFICCVVVHNLCSNVIVTSNFTLTRNEVYFCYCFKWFIYVVIQVHRIIWQWVTCKQAWNYHNRRL